MRNRKISKGAMPQQEGKKGRAPLTNVDVNRTYDYWSVSREEKEVFNVHNVDFQVVDLYILSFWKDCL